MKKGYPFYDQRPEFSDLRDLLAASAADFGEKCAISFRESPTDTEKQQISYRELERRVRALGTEFLSRGLAGKHCILIGKLSYSWVLSYFALLSVGAVLVPLDPEWTAEDLADTSRKAGGSFLICDNDLREKVPTICEPMGGCTPVFTKPGDGECLRDLLDAGQARLMNGDRSYETVPIDPDRLALLVFTSGTTGKGKGVMLSERCILSNIYSAQKVATLGEKTIGVLPPHHTFGSTVGILAPVCIGCELYLSAGLKNFAKELQQEKPDNLILVPLFLDTFAAKILSAIKKQGAEKAFRSMRKLSNGLRKCGVDLTGTLFGSVRKAFGGNLRQVICGGAPMSREVFDLFTSIGIRVLNGYGITECSPLISVNRPKEIVPDTAGLPVPDVSVRIEGCGEDGEGEILVKGPNVMLGYYEDPEATRAAIDPDGYFHTGDIGKLDPDSGFLCITGRMKNLIILSNGKNVYPEEIESALSAIPGVHELVVYEGQSRRGIAYNRIVAEIYPDPDFVKTQQIGNIEEYLHSHIERYNKTAVVYKRVGLIRIRETEFPKNTLRKILRFRIDRTIE